MPSKMRALPLRFSNERMRVRVLAAAYDAFLEAARIDRRNTGRYLDARVLGAVLQDRGWNVTVQMHKPTVAEKERVIRAFKKRFPNSDLDFADVSKTAK